MTRTLVCVPVMVEDVEASLADAAEAKRRGADVVEFRIDSFFDGAERGDLAEPSETGGAGGAGADAFTVAQLRRLFAESPLPTILTCRHASEGGLYDGDESDRVSLLEQLTAAVDRPEHAPAYLDVELARYTASANIRQKVNLCVAHPKQTRGVRTRLILSMHDFEGRPADLSRRLAQAYEEPACSVVKVAFRARSLRDNLELFEIVRGAPKPTIALGMGEFGLMSRVLAPKFGGYLTFAALREAAATAPGQPTIEQLLGMYRFRSIGPATKVYGVIGWPVGQSMSPLVHNAGFGAVGWDGVYLPLPVAADERDEEGSSASFKATVGALLEDEGLGFSGASVTIPHKERLVRAAAEGVGGLLMEHASERAVGAGAAGAGVEVGGAANTIVRGGFGGETELGRRGTAFRVANTDAAAVVGCLRTVMGDLSGRTVAIVGAGGVARAAAAALLREPGAAVVIFNRSPDRAAALVAALAGGGRRAGGASGEDAGVARVSSDSPEGLARSACDAYINGTPVGMAGGPDPTGLSIPVPEMFRVRADAVFFDTVYNPIETPMLRAARGRGFRTIDGVEMFVRQAEAQFLMWTGVAPPRGLFDRLVRERLGAR